MNQILLMSSSRMGTQGYLAHAGEQVHALLGAKPTRVLFIPFAGGITFSYDDYEQRVKPPFEQWGYALESIHRHADFRSAIAQAQCIAVGGGNTFALLKRLYEADIVDAIRAKVLAGTPYIGWSAGSNIACPTIRTTNDMPIVQPPTLKALGLVPFQINPHFISGKPAGHNGESREERLAEFLEMNAPEQVLALPEGSALLCDDTHGSVLGEHGAMHFSGKEAVTALAEGERFALSRITGPVGMDDWNRFRP
jgi:dipeptidase E